MKIGRAAELQCPRCRVVATRRPGRQERCTHCGAELVAAQSPSEDWVRAYLYGGDGEGLRIRPHELGIAVMRAAHADLPQAGTPARKSVR